MDRRTWLQLITILTAAREAKAQQRGGAATPPAEGAGRGGRGQGGFQNLPMRVTKEQVVGALKLLGLEFQDAEIDMMLRSVNHALASYEAAAQGRRPLRHRASLRIPPGAAGPHAHQRAAALRDHHSQSARDEGAVEPGRAGVLAVTELAPLVRSRAVSSTDLTKMYLARMKKYSPKLLCLITLTEDLALEAGRRSRQGNQSRQISRPAARHSVRREGPVRHQGHPHHLGRRAVPEARCPNTTPPAWSGCTRPARCSSASSRWARWRRATCGSRARPRVPWNRAEATRRIRPRIERLLGRLGVRHRGGLGGLLAGHGDAGLHRLAQHELRNGGPAPHLRPGQPPRRHGAELDHGQDRRPSAAAWKIAPSC